MAMINIIQESPLPSPPPKRKKVQRPDQELNSEYPSYKGLTGYSFTKLIKNLVKIIINEKPIGKILTKFW